MRTTRRLLPSATSRNPDGSTTMPRARNGMPVLMVVAGVFAAGTRRSAKFSCT
jgi:hypothetical protein